MSALSKKILQHARSKTGTLVPGMRIGRKTITEVGTHTVVYETDDGWTGVEQIPFIDPAAGESLPSHQRALAEAGVKENPSASATALVVGGAAAAGLIWWLLSRKPADNSCQITAEKLYAWNGGNWVLLYLFALSTPPSLPELQASWPQANNPARLLVVLKDGSFWSYASGKPVAAPELRASYCEYAKQWKQMS